MANLKTNSPVSAGDQVTAQTLHDLIETASLENLTPKDLEAGQTLIASQGSPPSPSDYTYWWDTRHVVGQVMRVWWPGFDTWVAFGPDRFEVPFIAAHDLRMGDLLTATAASIAGTATGVTLNYIGFAQNSAASGSGIPVCFLGLGFVRVACAASNPKAAIEGEFVSNRWSDAGEVDNHQTAAWNTITNLNRLAFALLLERRNTTYRPEADDDTGYRAIIFGPKLPREPN